MRRWLSSSDIPAALVAAALLGACIFAFFHSYDSSASVDDWRRTATGWERSTHWQLPAAQTQNPAQLSPNRRRFDTHPAVIALTQLTAALLVLTAFPTGRSIVTADPTAWPTQIARSFRASAFGS